MVLTYGNYIELMSALDEHCKGTLSKDELQNAIFTHYTSLYGNFVAENINGDKRLFTTFMWQSKSRVKQERKKFREFMNISLREKRKTKRKETS